MGSPAFEIDSRLRETESDAGHRVLSVVTWNVWRDAYRFDERTAGLLATLRSEDADLVCLQDVTRELRARILADEWIRDRYYVADADGIAEAASGAMLLSREPLHRIRHATTPPGFTCSVAHGAIRVHGRSIAVCSAHVPREQLHHLPRVIEDLTAIPEVIICGSFDDGFAVPHGVPELVDLWRALRGAHPGFTLDTVRNATAARQRPRDEQLRQDGVLSCSRTGLLSPRAIELVGTDPVAPSYDLYVSDHLGLRATFSLRP